MDTKIPGARHAHFLSASDKLISSIQRAVGEDADRKFQHSRKRALLQNIVPFLPLAPADLEWVANKELKQLGGALAVEYRGVWAGKLTWSKTVPHWMATR